MSGGGIIPDTGAATTPCRSDCGGTSANVSPPFIPDDAELVTDLPCILSELNRVKVLFQARAIASVLGLPVAGDVSTVAHDQEASS